MPATLDVHAVEQSTIAITAQFADENGDPVTPNSGLKWSLTDPDGRVINQRSEVAITPAPSVTVVLHGLDLALMTSGSPRRVLTFRGTYNSSLGSNLELNEQVEFLIDNLVVVAAVATG